MKEKLLKEINESIDGVERAMGENQYDNGYLDALYMVRDKIIKPILKQEDDTNGKKKID